MQFYFDPSRESDPDALPDGEVFWGTPDEGLKPSWYWWSCFPGCLPDGDPVGPFNSKQEALADAQSEVV